MKILIIDNNIDSDCWGSGNLCHLARLATGATIYVRRAPQLDLPKNPEAFDRIIVSGSKTSAMDDVPWVNELMNFIKRAVQLRKPYLGVCYGHQILARALGGKESVRRATQGEFGWTQIEVSDPSTLFLGISSPFYSFSSHFDEISTLPKGMKRLAFSELCAVQACQLENLPIFGIQFHPEKNVREADRILKDTRERFDEKSNAKKNSEKSSEKNGLPAILNPDRSVELYNFQIGEVIFKNFLTIEST